LAEEINRINYEPWISYHKITGERISGPEPATFVEMTYTHPDGTERAIPLHRQSRPKFMAALFTQLKKIGVDVTFGKRVVDYTEDEAEHKASILLDDGSKLAADIVIAADGVGTKSCKLATGTDIASYPSGLSILRTAFPVEMAVEDTEVADRWPLIDGRRPICELWQG
jgi:2-polyprenyl-6-methoxyphenol hydroxylase-like FAD-dependent oxidoreductase